jgi:tetratricopeptide (TPR) repeat protein
VAVAVLVLVVISAAVAVWARKRPYLLVGWLWYLGTLTPVIGLVQVGAQAMADRYTYLTQIGLYVAAAWAVSDLTARWRRRGPACGAAAALVLAALTSCAWVQTAYWRNSEALWSHAMDCTSGNWYAFNGLGNILKDRGDLNGAVDYYQQALKLCPDHVASLTNMGIVARKQGRLKEALDYYHRALALDPTYVQAYNNLGNAESELGHVEEAIHYYEKALQLNSSYTEVEWNLARALVQAGRLDEAAAHFQRAIKLAGIGLANALRRQGKADEAVGPLDLTAWTLATSPQSSLRNGAAAIELAEFAAQLDGGRDPAVLDTLAAAYAEAGRFHEAVETARKALALAQGRKQDDLASHLQERIKLYQAGTPFHEGQ